MQSGSLLDLCNISRVRVITVVAIGKSGTLMCRYPAVVVYGRTDPLVISLYSRTYKRSCNFNRKLKMPVRLFVLSNVSNRHFEPLLSLLCSGVSLVLECGRIGNRMWRYPVAIESQFQRSCVALPSW